MTQDLQGIGWELATIGTVLSDPETMELAAELDPRDFSRSNRVVWSAVRRLHDRNALEVRGLIEELRGREDLEGVGADIGDPDIRGEQYISECLTYRGGQIKLYVDQVVDRATKRQLRDAGALIAADAAHDDRDADELLDEAERRITALRRTRGVEGNTFGQILSAFMPRLEGMRTGEIQPAATPNLDGVKSILPYLEHEDFMIVAGRPGTGKSSYLRFEAMKWAQKGVPGVIVNMENSEGEYAKYAIANHTGINSEKLRVPRRLSNNELERVREAARELASLPIYVVTMSSPTVAEVERALRAQQRAHDIEYIMVDYLQLISNGLENRVNDVTLTSQKLRALAMPPAINVPVIAAAQLNRAIVHRGGEPQLSDLRESGSLEQDATIVMVPRIAWSNPTDNEKRQFPENVDPQGNTLRNLRAEPVRFYVLKQRNGPTGVTEMIKWDKGTSNYQTLRRPL